MELQGTIEIVLGIITTLTTGGIVGSIIGLKYASRKEKAKAKQEEEHAESLDISNTSSLISLYKTTIEDLQSLREKTESQYKITIQALEDKIESQKETISEQEVQITELTKNLLSLGVKLKTLQSNKDKLNSDHNE